MSSNKDFVIENGVLKKYTGSDSDVVIPEGVTTIKGEDIFYGLDNIKYIRIPKSVTVINSYAFTDPDEYGNLEFLEGVFVDKGNPNYYSIDGMLISKDGCLMFCPKEKRGKVVVPDSVSRIGKYAFFRCKKVDSIILPNSIKSIEDNAFASCTSLKSISMSNSVTDIGGGAFFRCESLESIVIPDSVKIFGDSVFSYCSSLKSVTIPYGINGIKNKDGFDVGIVSSFIRCTSLVSINVENGNDAYCSVDGVLFNKNKTELIKYPSGNKKSKYEIPNSVMSIGRHAFDSCTSLKNIIIPNSVTEIGCSAFEECKNLESIIIPNGVKKVDNTTFQRCKNLKKVVIPDSVDTIGWDAFFECENLKSILIPNSILSIRSYAFSCTGLKDIYYKGTKQQWDNIFKNVELPVGAKVHFDSKYLNDLSEIEKEVRKLLSEGKSEAEIYKTLKTKGNTSDNDIVNALSKVNFNSPMVLSFCDKVILPDITSLLGKGRGESKYTIGEVAEIMYKKHPKPLVDSAIVKVLYNEYLVD